MASGTVKWFNATKGFGFIQPDSGGKDVFVHISAVERAGLQGLNEGQKISYEVQNGTRQGRGGESQGLKQRPPRGASISRTAGGPIRGGLAQQSEFPRRLENGCPTRI